MQYDAAMMTLIEGSILAVIVVFLFLRDYRATAISALAMLDPSVRDRGLGALARDLESGAWAARHADLAGRTELDLGYRLLIARHN